MTQTKTYRIKLSTYKRLRRVFEAERGETTAHYFERLTKFLEQRGKRYGFN